jgi:hypothetical protein
MAPPMRPNVRFGSKADMCGAQAHVRFVPIADMRRQPLRGSKLGDANFKWQWAGAFYGPGQRSKAVQKTTVYFPPF